MFVPIHMYIDNTMNVAQAYWRELKSLVTLQWIKNYLLVVGHMNILYVLHTVTAVCVQQELFNFKFHLRRPPHSVENLPNTGEQ